MVYTDFRKRFEQVPSPKILYTVIRGKFLCRIKSLLKDRNQRLGIKSQSLKWKGYRWSTKEIGIYK